MTKLPNFNINNPSTKEEKLLVELVMNLHETVAVFTKFNFDMKKSMKIEDFIVLRDGVINFSAQIIGVLINGLYDKKYVDEIINETIKIFTAQLNDIKENSK